MIYDTLYCLDISKINVNFYSIFILDGGFILNVLVEEISRYQKKN